MASVDCAESALTQLLKYFIQFIFVVVLVLLLYLRIQIIVHPIKYILITQLYAGCKLLSDAHLVFLFQRRYHRHLHWEGRYTICTIYIEAIM